MSWRVVLIGAAVVAAVALAGCGGASSSGGAASSGVVARVGDTPVTEAALDHWTSVMALRDAGSATSKQSPRQQALSFLISTEWQIGEVAEQGQPVSHAEVEQRLQERRRSYKNGEAEFHEALAVSGETVADVMLAIEAELASSRLSRLLARHGADVAAITPAQVASYYRMNKHAFTTAEERQVEIIHTENAAMARKIAKEGAPGKKLVNVTEPESLVYVKGLKGGTNTVLAKRIFESPRGRFVGPVRVGPNYFVFEVTLITPATQSTLAQVRGTIEHTLTTEARQQAVAAVVKTWRTTWIAKTDCRAGLVVQKCRQYVPSKATPPEAPLVFE